MITGAEQIGNDHTCIVSSMMIATTSTMDERVAPAAAAEEEKEVKLPPSARPPPPPPRPILQEHHITNLHSDSFLDNDQSDDEYDNDKMNDGQRRRRGFQEDHHRQDVLRRNYPENILERILSDTKEWSKFHDALRQKRTRCCTHASIQQCIIHQLISIQEEDQGTKQQPQRHVEEEYHEGKDNVVETVQSVVPAASETSSSSSPSSLTTEAPFISIADEEGTLLLASPLAVEHVPAYRFRSSLMCNDNDARQRRVYGTYLKAVVACRRSHS